MKIASFMSNTKWRKLFTALEADGLTVHHSNWFFTSGDGPVLYPIFPSEKDLTESGLRDGRFNPIQFKEILRIEVPETYPDPRSDTNRVLPKKIQDLHSLCACFERIGQIQMEMTEHTLVIHAYSTET